MRPDCMSWIAHADPRIFVHTVLEVWNEGKTGNTWTNPTCAPSQAEDLAGHQPRHPLDFIKRLYSKGCFAMNLKPHHLLQTTTCLLTMQAEELRC